jgi:hypothetical protein
MRPDNSRHLTAAAARRRTQCIARVDAVLDDLERGRGRVSVATVAAAAGVSRTFLYDPAQRDLLSRLRGIAAGRRHDGRVPIPTDQRISTASHEQVVRALRKRNQRLSQDNKRLRGELAIALGQLREIRRGAGPSQAPQPDAATGTATTRP